MYHRLKHNDPRMNDKDRWWVAVGETPWFYLTVMYGKSNGGKAGCLNSTVHAALKTDYTIVEAYHPDRAADVPKEDDASDLL